MLDPNFGRPVRAVTVHPLGAILTPDGRPIRLMCDVGAAVFQTQGSPVWAVAVQPGRIASDGQVCEAIAWAPDVLTHDLGRPVYPAGVFIL